MEKEIFISKKIKSKVNKNFEFNRNLKIIADTLSKDCNIKIYFCEILGGRRWSYIAGSKDIMAPTKKIKIDSKLGIVIDNYDKLQENNWKSIIKIVKELK